MSRVKSIFLPQNIGKPLTSILRAQLLLEVEELENIKKGLFSKSQVDFKTFEEWSRYEDQKSSEITCYEHDIYFMKRTLETGIIQMGEELDEQHYRG